MKFHTRVRNFLSSKIEAQNGGKITDEEISVLKNPELPPLRSVQLYDKVYANT